MASKAHHPGLSRLACLTAGVALLPIIVGAIVTTMNWGMAFADWPTSDGYMMLTYPWLGDWLRSAMDKFTEHGHRLAGLLVGVCSIVLCATAWRVSTRRSVRILATLALLAVVMQGLLGGFRVLFDQRTLALIHGLSAGMVFSLLLLLANVTSRQWIEPPAVDSTQSKRALIAAVASAAALLVVVVQFVLGGLIRHRHVALFEHAGFAVITGLAVATAAILAWRVRSGWLRRPAAWLGAVLLVQLGLGLSAWVARFGLGEWAVRWGLLSPHYVPVEHSPVQIVLRTSHAIVGILLMGATVVLLSRSAHLAHHVPTSEAESCNNGSATAYGQHADLSSRAMQHAEGSTKGLARKSVWVGIGARG